MPRHADATDDPDPRPTTGAPVVALLPEQHAPRGRHADLADRATADFLAGDYSAVRQACSPADVARLSRPYLAAPPLVPATGFLPLSQPACAIVLYAPGGGANTVVAPFPDDRTAHDYAIEHGFRDYSVVPATTVWLPSGR
jgi:hypothetical protein